MDYKAEYQAQMTALADSIRKKAGTSAKMTIDQMSSAVENIGNQSWTWYKNAVEGAVKSSPSSGSLTKYILSLPSSPKKLDCFIICTLDVTNCTVLIAGRQMQNGEGWSATSDFTAGDNNSMPTISSGGNIKTKLQAQPYANYISSYTIFWYLEGNALYLLNPATYGKLIYYKEAIADGSGVVTSGITILGTPSITTPTISISTEKVSASSLKIVTSSRSIALREGNSSYTTLLPSGLAGKTAIFGVMLEKGGSTFSLITTTLQE